MGSRQPLLAAPSKEIKFSFAAFLEGISSGRSLQKLLQTFEFRNGSQSVTRAEPEREHS